MTSEEIRTVRQIFFGFLKETRERERERLSSVIM
jgi:hypothetical protein